MNVLVACYSGLGNLILRIPFFKKIQELYPHCHLDILTNEEVIGNVSPLVPFIPEMRHIYQLSLNASFKEKLLFFKKLRKENYAVLFLPFDSKPPFLQFFSYFSKISLRVMHEEFCTLSYLKSLKKAAKMALFPKTLFVPLVQGRHEIDLNLDLLEAFYNAPFERTHETPLVFQEKKSTLETFLLQKNRYIVIQLSARQGLATPKTWDPCNFFALVQQIHANHPSLQIVLVGSKIEQENLIGNFAASCPFVINTAGKTSMADVITILQGAKAVIAHDSGLMHIANALNTPLIALFGPTDFTRTQPLGKQTTLLFSKNRWFASMYNFKKTEEKLAQETNPYACMSAISVEDVLSALNAKLSKN
jgi:lipopolysaccharide heptosyltransferase II